MENKVATVVISDDGVLVEMDGPWTRRDLDTARLAMHKKLNEIVSMKRIGGRDAR